MFRDCYRCGHGWHSKRFGESSCPICTGMADDQAKFVLDQRNDITRLRQIARKAYASAAYTGLSNEEGNKIGFYL